MDTKSLKFAVTGIFFLLIIAGIYNRAGHFVRNAELFKIKMIVKAPSLQFIQSRHLTRLTGKNIFDVDLETVQKRLQSQYPKVKQLRVFRKFPDKIYVAAKKREPFAFLRLNDRNILIDKDIVILSVDAAIDPKLPVIRGIKIGTKVTPGKPLRRRKVDIAVDIIKMVHKNKSFAPLYVASIDVGNLSEIDFRLSNKLKVIIDERRVYQKIKKLEILLSQGNLDFKDIHYIDLRFKEPLLKKK